MIISQHAKNKLGSLQHVRLLELDNPFLKTKSVNNTFSGVLMFVAKKDVAGSICSQIISAS